MMVKFVDLVVFYIYSLDNLEKSQNYGHLGGSKYSYFMVISLHVSHSAIIIMKSFRVFTTKKVIKNHVFNISTNIYGL